ncbi:MAG: DUF4097 family beta strand repeat-containing protein [Gemmatimonadaceae bacterium]
MRTLLPMLALLCTTTACGRRAHDVSDAFHWEAELEPGTTIHLRTVTGQIEVTPADGRSARITGSTHWVGRRDPVHFAWSRDGDEVYVCALWTSNGDCSDDRHGFSGSDHSWLDMFSLFKRRSTNVTASLRVALPPGVKIDAHTMNGPISMFGATAGITARTLNGSIKIQHSAGPVEAKGTNGSIEVSLDSLGPEDAIVLESVNGSMKATVPPTLDGDVQLKTVNGGVRSDFSMSGDGEMSSHSLHGQIGSSSREVVLKTVNGDVSLLKLQDGRSGDVPPPARARRRKG